MAIPNVFPRVTGGKYVRGHLRIILLYDVLFGYYLNALLSSTFSQHKYTPIIKKSVLVAAIATTCYDVWNVWAPEPESDFRKKCGKVVSYIPKVLFYGGLGCQVYRLRDPGARVSAVIAITIEVLDHFNLLQYVGTDKNISFKVNKGKWGIKRLDIGIPWIALGAITGYKYFRG